MNFNPWTIILFLPAAACLFWLLLNRLVARSTSTYMVLQLLALDLALFLAADAFYAMPGVPPEMLVWTHLVSLFTAPCIIPLVWLYFDRLRHGVRFTPMQLAWLAIPIALVSSGISLTGTIGVERLSTFIDDLNSGDPNVLNLYQGTALGHYYIWAHLLFRAAVALEIVCAAVYLLVYVVKEKVKISALFAYSRRDEPIRVTDMQIFSLIVPGLVAVFKLALPKYFLDSHLLLSLIIAVVFTWSYFSFMLHSLMGERKSMTKTQLRHVMLYNFNPSNKGPVVELLMDELLEDAEQEALVRLKAKLGETVGLDDELQSKEVSTVKELLFSTAASSWDDSLLTRFQTLMLNEQLFLQPGLSLQDVAQKLHTNKTYISKLVNNCYNLGFPELLNTLRIDYAEQYIISHPNARQEEIAKACGFLSASAFNNMFRKITGMTPKVWMLSIDNKRSNAQ